MIRDLVLVLVMTAVVGVFSQWPRFAPLAEDHGRLTLSLAHLADRMEPCRPLTPEEIAALPPNMRVTERCSRARAPTRIHLELDGETLFAAEVPAAGLHQDGRAYLVRDWDIPAGTHTLDLRLRDTPGDDGHDEHGRFTFELRPGQSVVLRVGDGPAELDNLEW